MEYQIKYVFVQTYYNNLYQYLNRIIEFVESYYEMVLMYDFDFKEDQFQQLGTNIITFGEIIPYFLNHIEIKNFVMSSGTDKSEILTAIENYVLSFKDKDIDDRDKSIIISLTHIQKEAETD